MKFTTTALLLLLPLVVVARPTWDHDSADTAQWDDEHKKDGVDHHANTHDDEWKGAFPFHFTSTIVAYAGPDGVVNNSNVPVAGLPEGWVKFAFGLNSEEDVICYNITAWLRGNYSSPARTATHIHQAPVGMAGPPRIAFPNPVPRNGEDLEEYSWRSSIGCLTGPFSTGIVVNGSDTGSNFTVATLEADPTAFFADTHTVEFPAGAVRGQLQWY